MKRRLAFLSLGLFVLFNSCSNIQIDNPEITKEELRNHIEYLASYSLKGRMPGTPGDALAASYIKNSLSKLGYKLMADKGFQYFDIVTEVIANKNRNRGILSINDISITLIFVLIQLSNIGLIASMKSAIFLMFGPDC